MIIELTEKYLEKCIEIYLKVFNAVPFNYTWLIKETAFKYFKDTLSHPRFLGYIFYFNDELLGGCLGHIDDYFLTSQYEIKELFLKVECQSQGLGSTFLREIEDDLAKRNIGFVTLLTQSNIRAFDFYQKNEYTVSTNTVFMTKEIRSSV